MGGLVDGWMDGWMVGVVGLVGLVGMVGLVGAVGLIGMIGGAGDRVRVQLCGHSSAKKVFRIVFAKTL